MTISYEALQLFQLFVYVAVGFAAVIHWFRRRSSPAAWMAATLTVLAWVIVMARLLPSDPRTEPAELWLFRLLIAALTLFPYFLFRFHASLLPVKSWISLAATGLTLATMLFAFVLPEFPSPGEERPAIIEAWVLLLAFQWTSLSTQVAFRLWRAGSRQPTVTRRRMRTIALGATTLSALIVLGALSPPSARVGSRQFVTALLATLSAPMFLLGFAPPKWIVAVWRRRDDVSLREAEIALIRAVTPQQVAELLLPRLSDVMGGGAAVLLDREDRILGSHLLADDKLAMTPLSRQSEEGSKEAQTIESVEFDRGRLEVVTSPLAPYFGDEERKTLQAIGTLTDMALARAELVDRERKNVENMRDFVAIASHDLRTPIAVISGIGMTIRQQWHRLTEDQKFDLAGRIENHANRLTRLVEDLLTVSKIESGSVEAQIERVELLPVVAEVLEEIDSDQSSVKTEVPSGTFAMADRDYCLRILRNYLTNAINYGASPITISARARGGWVELRVSDSGKGVPEEFVPRLFEKFARADRKTAKSEEGTGLGLSIVRGLAKAMKGDAFYEADTPHGASFGVRLPAADTETQQKD